MAQMLTLKRRTNKKQQRKHGFRARMKTHSGRQVLKRRRGKGRLKLSI